MIRVAAFVGLVAILCSPAVQAEDPDRQQAEKPTEVIRLFDGTLDNFYTWIKGSERKDPDRVFRVTDGMLHVTGNGLGSLTTKKMYRDYHCVLEFKWGERTWPPREAKTRDSGLLVHSQGADGGYNGIWMPSIEVQIIEGGMGDFILVSGTDKEGKPVPLSVTAEVARDRDGEVVWKKGGTKETFDMQNRKRINWYGRDPDWADTIGFRGKDDPDSPLGQWTRFDVFCEGDTIRTFVNGVQVNEGTDVYPSFGHLQLQTELAEVFVRRWELWPIGEGPQPAPAKQ